MSSLVKKLATLAGSGCVVTRVKKGRCRIDLTNAPTPHLIVDCDAMSSFAGDESRPDYLFVSDVGDQDDGGHQSGTDSGLFVPLEVSAGSSKSADKIRRQLQAGVDWFASNLSLSQLPRLVPVYCGHRLDPYVARKLRKPEAEVHFRGTKVTPRVIKCGDRLTKALT